MLSALYDELKRRNVFKVAGAYLLVAWLMLQVAGSLESALELPRWFDGLVVAALAIFFPVTLVIAWAFELTKDGVKRTPKDEGRAAGFSGLVVTGLLLVAVLGGGGIAAYWFMTVETPEPLVESRADSAVAGAAIDQDLPEPQTDAIAVLPMASLDPGDEMLARLGIGISDELRNVLARVQGVRVASRPSSIAYLGQDRPGSRQMARELDVGYILDGSLQKAGDTLRVTVQLIEGRSDSQVMSRRFDLPLSVDNIFAIQDRIAEEVVTSLGRNLGASARDALRFVAASATDSLPAYNAYIDGRLGFSRRNRVRNPEEFDAVTRNFEDATRIDPEFGHAWAALAMQYYTLIAWGGDQEQMREKAREAARRALSLDDNLALAHAVLGITASLPDGRIDRVSAIDGLTRAINLDPFEPALWSWRGQHWIELGFFRNGIEDLGKTIDLSLGDGVANFWTINARLFLGEVDRAMERIQTGLVDSIRFRTMLALAIKEWEGDETARDFLLDSKDNRDLFAEVAAALTDGDYDHDSGYARLRLSAGEDENLLGQLGHPTVLYAFKQYDQLPAEPPLSGRLTWWHGAHEDFNQSAVRYGYFHDLGLEDYWFARDFPPRCERDDSAEGYRCE